MSRETADELGEFVRLLAHRIASFPAAGRAIVKERVNRIALAPVEEFRHDSDLFGESATQAGTQRLIQSALQRGFQTRDWELSLGSKLGT